MVHAAALEAVAVKASGFDSLGGYDITALILSLDLIISTVYGRAWLLASLAFLLRTCVFGR